MKKLLFAVCLICSGILTKAQNNMNQDDGKELYLIEVYLCSETDQISWEEGLKDKLIEYGVAFEEEKKADESECLVEDIPCSSRLECDQIIAVLEGKKIKIRSGMHSDDVDDLFKSASLKISLQNKVKVIQIIDKVSKRVLYTRNLRRVAPLIYSGNAVKKTALSPQQITMYKAKSNIHQRGAFMGEVLDRMSFSISIRKRK